MNQNYSIRLFPLSKLPAQQSAVIAELSGAEYIKKRLCSLGFMPGISITCIGESPLGDPKAYLIRGCIIALRITDSQNILVREVEAFA